MILDSSHVILSSFVALAAWGLAVRLAPFLWHLANAFFVGFIVALLASFWFTLTTSRARDTRPKPLRRFIPAFTLPSIWETEREWRDTTLHYDPIQLHPSSVVVSDALGQLITLALQDFVSSWYKAISSSPVFVNELDKNVRVAIVEIRDRMLQHDVVDMVIARIIPIVTGHLREFDNADRTVRGRTQNRSLLESEELDLAIASNYKDGILHPAASLAFSDTKSLQQAHLRKLLVRILPSVLDESTIGSRAVSVLIKEIVACAVLHPILQMSADPDTWNQMVEAYGKSAIQDRKTVRRMRAALDEHTSSPGKKQTPLETPRLQAHDNERAFERFVRAIRKTKTLADARRFRNQIASQLVREHSVEGQDPVYLRRLEMGKRVLDQKIAKMTSSADGLETNVTTDRQVDVTVKVPSWTLVHIMHTAAGLSYFMEFMDRQGSMPLVQFWVVVDGFRNPLEDDFGDERTTSPLTWTDNDRLDIAQIAESYIMKVDLNIPKELQDTIQEFLQNGRKASPAQYRAARVAVLTSQSIVFEELEHKYLPKFRESDLYYKFLASDEGRPPRRQQSVQLDDDSGSKLPPARPKLSTASVGRTTNQAPMSKATDLRRAALSSSDVKSLASLKGAEATPPVRRSLDIDRPLFDDDYENDPLALSVQSLGTESLSGDPQTEPGVIENMQAAMTDIMAEGPNMVMSDIEPDTPFASPISTPPLVRPSLESSRIDSAASEKLKPSLATLGLVNSAGRIGVFQDNDLFGDEDKFAEDEYVDEDIESRKDKDEEIHQAAPGDLGLTEAITALSDDIEHLVSQEGVVDALTRKAELTNNIAELRILGKSKASLQREIRRKELQRQQYIVQESDNSLYGRASIVIDSVMVGREDDGQEYAVYLIKIQRQAGSKMAAASWAIAHRYSEFHELHQRLRRRYPSTRNLEFPRRRVVMKLQKQFLQNRRLALESYLRELLRMPDVCRSREFRSFLSQQAIVQPEKSGNNTHPVNTQDMVARIYNSVTDGMDEFLGNMAVLDQLSIAGQNLISAATNQINTSTTSGVAVNANNDAVDTFIEPGSIAEAEAELRAFEDKELAPFVKPICDIFLETFELNRGNNWLRGRAVVVVIHQLLGGTVERKVRDSFVSLFSIDALLRYISTAKDTMWPLVANTDADAGGAIPSQERKIRTPGPQRTKVQKEASRREAGAVLGTLIPELTGSVVGRANAQSAARRIAAVMNNKRLNEHLVYTILDEIVAYLFDGVGVPGAPGPKLRKGKGKW